MTVFLEDNKKSEQVKIQDSEKNAVITLLVFITAVYLIAIGIQVGKWSAMALTALGV